MATGTATRPKSAYRRRRRRRRKIYRLIRRLFFLACLLALATVAYKAIFRPAEEEQGDPPSATPEVSATPSAVTASVTAQDWRLVLVNPWHLLPEGYTIETVSLRNGLQVDKRCYSDLQEMMDACRAAGLSPVICSAYRSHETQESLFENKISRLMAEGYSRADAEAEAGTVVAVPGTSEHELGLALDIVDMRNQALDESQENTGVQRWLIEHSWEYGFILRYPVAKSQITGIIYEPWHYRYVGRENAEKIHARGVCLEEYLDVSGI